MTTVVLEKETNSYWKLLKNLSAEVKLALIVRLSGSLMREAVEDKSEADSPLTRFSKMRLLMFR